MMHYCLLKALYTHTGVSSHGADQAAQVGVLQKSLYFMRVKQQEKLTDPLKSQKHLLFLVAQDDNKILWCVQKKSLQIYKKKNPHHIHVANAHFVWCVQLCGRDAPWPNVNIMYSILNQSQRNFPLVFYTSSDMQCHVCGKLCNVHFEGGFFSLCQTTLVSVCVKKKDPLT